ncbi:MAG: SET domain-containing protein [Candidatus Nealsonbacteria bacterium]|nr:SET domain-containing protein [Candidatus Nealsonbacteria bacterium]
MKKRHSYLTPKAEARKSKIMGKGVFAKEKIKRGELIALWGGYVISLGEMKKLPQEILRFDYPVQIYEGFYLGPKKVSDLDDAEMFNHSCDPNAGVKGQNILVARRNIESGEEICFDYETTDSRGLKILCECGFKICRKVINGISWKDPKFQKKNQGYFSWYLEEKIKRLVASIKKNH